MTDEHDDELLTRLRAADPARSLPAADPDRVARLLEDAMSHDLLTESRETGTRHRSPLTWLVAAAAALIIAGVGAFAVMQRDQNGPNPPSAGDDPTVTEVMAPSPEAAGRCMVPNADTLARAAVAFAGTVDEIAGDQVTLTPSTWYAGTPTDQVVVDAWSPDLRLLVGAVDFEVGEKYLVAADAEGDMLVCGFSGAYDERIARLYAQAFPG